MRAMFPDRFLVLVLAGLSADSASAGQTEPAFLSRAPQALALAFGSGDGTFHRLRQDCTTLAGSAANAVYYDTVVLGNPNNVELVLDVRTPTEWSAGHIDGALHIPLIELESRMAEVPRDRQLAVICRTSNRSASAVSLLRRAGIANLLHVLGGMSKWAPATAGSCSGGAKPCSGGKS